MWITCFTKLNIKQVIHICCAWAHHSFALAYWTLVCCFWFFMQFINCMLEDALKKFHQESLAPLRRFWGKPWRISFWTSSWTSLRKVARTSPTNPCRAPEGFPHSSIKTPLRLHQGCLWDSPRFSLRNHWRDSSGLVKHVFKDFLYELLNGSLRKLLEYVLKEFPNESLQKPLRDPWGDPQAIHEEVLQGSSRNTWRDGAGNT